MTLTEIEKLAEFVKDVWGDNRNETDLANVTLTLCKLVKLQREALEQIERASWKECASCKNSSEYAYEIARDALAAGVGE